VQVLPPTVASRMHWRRTGTRHGPTSCVPGKAQELQRHMHGVHVPGSSGVAVRNGARRGMLSSHRHVPRLGAVRIRKPDPAGRRVNSVKPRRGPLPAFQERIREPRQHCAGVTWRTVHDRRTLRARRAAAGNRASTVDRTQRLRRPPALPPPRVSRPPTSNLQPPTSNLQPPAQSGQCTPLLICRVAGSAPRRRMAFSHICSGAVRNTISGSTSLSSHDDSASSASSCPGPQPE
jgi:hypothetical protein